MSILESSAAGEVARNWIDSSATMRDLDPEDGNPPRVGSETASERRPGGPRRTPLGPDARTRREIRVIVNLP